MLSVGYVGQKMGYSSGASGGVRITRKKLYFALFFIVILHQKSKRNANEKKNFIRWNARGSGHDI